MSGINESDYTYEVGDIVKIVEFAGFYYPDNIPDYYSEWMVIQDNRNVDYDADYPGPLVVPVVFNEDLHMYEVAHDFDGGITISVPHDYTGKSGTGDIKVEPSGAKCVPACFLVKTGDSVVLLAAHELPGEKGCNVPEGVVTMVYTKTARQGGRMRIVGTAYSTEFAAYMAKVFMDRIAENGKGESGGGGEDTVEPS